MYWGLPDASVSFCENKYEKNEYIAEYYNTISAIPYILVGIFYYKSGLKKIGGSIIFLGLGTIILHGTLRYYGQLLDESSMLILSFNIINKIRERRFLKEFSNIYCFFLIIFYFIFYNKFYVFFIIFGSLQFYTYNLITNGKNSNLLKKNWWIIIYKNVFLFSFFCWTLDQLFCEYVKYLYLHAIWHIGTSISLFTGLVPFLIN